MVFIAGEISQPLTEWSRKRAVSDMTTFLAACSAADSVETCIRDGEPAETIRNRAEEIEADLIAMGTRGNSGVTRILLGSVAERVLRTAPCPVLTVKPE